MIRADQICTIDDYECTDPGQTHVIRDGWKGIMLNDPHYCIRCTRRLWRTEQGWYARRHAYRIDEEPV